MRPTITIPALLARFVSFRNEFFEYLQPFYILRASVSENLIEIETTIAHASRILEQERRKGEWARRTIAPEIPPLDPEGQLEQRFSTRPPLLAEQRKRGFSAPFSPTFRRIRRSLHTVGESEIARPLNCFVPADG